MRSEFFHKSRDELVLLLLLDHGRQDGDVAAYGADVYGCYKLRHLFRQLRGLAVGERAVVLIANGEQLGLHRE